MAVEKLIRPRINLNGSPKSDLIAPRMEAVELIDKAIDALRLTTPNGRDYPHGEQHWAKDRTRHYDRLRQLDAIRTALYAEAIEIKRS